MNPLLANSTRGQLKIQEMSFVIVAIVIFFAMVAVLVISIVFSNINGSAKDIKDTNARKLISTIASSPEFAWTEQCESCVDKDKLFALSKQKEKYSSFWGVDYLAIENIYPKYQGECTGANYPYCESITLVNKTEYYGTLSEAYISLCNEASDGTARCELAKIVASIGSAG
jgi:hypothetical protein